MMNMDKLHNGNPEASREKRLLSGDIDGKVEVLKDVEGIDPRLFSLYATWKAEYGELVGPIWALGSTTSSGISTLEQDFFAHKRGTSISLHDLDTYIANRSEAIRFNAFYERLEGMGMVTIEDNDIRFTQRCEGLMKFRALCRLIEVLYASSFGGEHAIPLSRDQELLLGPDLA